MQSDPTTSSVPLVAGHLRLECRLVVWTICPHCGREHARVLGPEDRPNLPGTRHWVLECAECRYVVRVSADLIASARRRAHRIARLHGLSERWRASDACVRADVRRTAGGDIAGDAHAAYDD